MGRGVGTVAAVMALVATALLPGASPAQATDPNAWTEFDTYIASTNGVKLHAQVFRPAGVGADDPTPVILTVSPYATTGAEPLSPTAINNDITPDPGGFAKSAQVFAHGYTVVSVALRGYGASTGCFDEGGPGEQADVKAAVEWAADQSWSTHKVGMVGHSYDGQTQLMALGMRPRGLAAVIPSAAPAGYVNFFTDGVSNVTGRAFGAFYLISDLLPPSLKAPLEHHLNALHGPLSYPLCYATTPAGTYSNDPHGKYWADRDLAAKAEGSTIPALVEQGFDDFNVRATSFTELWPRLAGPKRALLGPWDHGIGGNNAERLRWLDAYVKEDPAAKAYEDSAPRVTVQDQDGNYRNENAWPPTDVSNRNLRLRAGRYIDGGINSSETEPPPAVTGAVGVVPPVALPTGNGTWTFSPPLAREAHVSGTPSVNVSLQAPLPGATLIALLYDIDPAGRANLIARGAHLVRSRGQRNVTATLYPTDWRVPAGHRIGLLLTGDDLLWLEAGKSQLPITVLWGNLTLPVLGSPRTAFVPGPYKPVHQAPPFTVRPATIANRTTTPLQ